MLSTFVSEHLGTLVVGTVVAAVLVALVFYLARSRRKSGGGCGCGCSSCPMKDKCHTETDATEVKR